MALTDTACKNSKCPAEKARIRLADFGGLYLEVVPTGGKLWRWKYRYAGKEKRLAIGSYPETSLAQARRANGTIDAALMGLPEAMPDVESEPLFEDDIYFAAPANSIYSGQPSIDLGACREENFVSLNEGFVTQNGFTEAFRIAQFTPRVVMKTGDIFSLMNLVGGGVGCTLLPGRVRGVLPSDVRLIPLQPKYLVRQTIALSFLRSRERDPNLLALLAVCRTSKLGMQ